MHNHVLAIGFALASALLIAWGTVWRHRILRAGRTSTEVNASPLRSLRRPAWWASLSLALAAYGLQALALAFGSLLVVQPILVLSLMFTLVLSARVARRRMSSYEVLWAVVLSSCVMVVLLLGRPLPGTPTTAEWAWGAAISAGVIATVSVFALAPRWKAQLQALIFGVLCGVVFGYLAVFSKVAVDVFATGGLPAMLDTWQFWAMLACAVLGTAVQQYAFGAGDLSLTLPAMKVAEPLVAITLGVTLLGEQFQVATVLGWATITAAICGMCIAVIMLTRV